MSVPADGQPSGLDYLPSHQEAATSAAWARPSLEGDKTRQSLNALMERTEERRRRLQEHRWRKQGQEEEGKQEKISFFSRQGGGKLRDVLAEKKTSAKLRFRAKRTDIVVHRLKQRQSGSQKALKRERQLKAREVIH